MNSVTKIQSTTINDADIDAVSEAVGSQFALYRVLMESKAKGNDFVDADLAAEIERRGFVETEVALHQTNCSMLAMICGILERAREAKGKLAAVVAKRREIERQIADFPALTRPQKVEQDTRLSEVKEEESELRESIADVNRYACTSDQYIDPAFFVEANKASADLQELRDKYDSIRKECRPKVKVEVVSVDCGESSYTAKRNFELGESYLESQIKWAENDKQRREAEKELLRLKGAKRRLAEVTLQLEQQAELVAELESRPLRPAFFKI